jgi:hypothetical protein
MLKQMNKLLAATSGMIIFAVLSLVPLWRASVYSPNARLSAIVYGAPALGLYLATLVLISRLKKRLTAA